MSRLILLLMAVALAAVSAFAHQKPRTEITVTGSNGPHKWTIPGDSTANHMKDTKIGDPANRMKVPVSNGDVVAFVVNTGNHSVIFENAVSEQKVGVWEVVKGSGILEELPKKLKFFNHDDARNSKADDGDLIKIRVLKLDKGKSILFACNPHSDTQADVEMVGALVLK